MRPTFNRITSNPRCPVYEIVLPVPPSEIDEGRGPHETSYGNIEAVNAMFHKATEERAHILVRYQDIEIAPETVAHLAAGFSEDPYFGVIYPRILRPEGDPYMFDGGGASPLGRCCSRRILPRLRPYCISLEMLIPCALLRNTLVECLSPLDSTLSSVEGAVVDLLNRARTVGFRGVIDNRAGAYVGADTLDVGRPIADADIGRFFRERPDMHAARYEFSKQSFVLEEKLLSCVVALGPKRLLLDATGMRGFHNGTSEAALSLMDAMYLDNGAFDFEVSVMSIDEAREFHRLGYRYPAWKMVGPEDSDHYAIMLRLNQPWSVSEIVSFHRRAFFNVVTMLDTICWDVQYPAPPGLTEAWETCAQVVDGIVYISEFSRDRFRRRFPVSPRVRELAQLYSLSPADYLPHSHSEQVEEGIEPYILVVGNSLEHKFVGPTVSTLAEAFPYERIKALGLSSSDNEQVEPIVSGGLSDAAIDELYRGAKLVVFPSFYEGFGFPVLRGLAWGKSVIVRDLSLYQEISSRYRGPGRICVFSDPVELFEIVGRILHEQPVASLPTGGSLRDGEEPPNWATVARATLSFMWSLCREPNLEHWRHRDWLSRVTTCEVK